MAGFLIFVLSPFLAALLPAALRGQLGQRPVDVMRGVAVVCRHSQSEGSPEVCLMCKPGVLTLNVLFMVIVQLLIGYCGSRAEDLLEAMHAQSLVQVTIVFFVTARSPM